MSLSMSFVGICSLYLKLPSESFAYTTILLFTLSYIAINPLSSTKKQDAGTPSPSVSGTKNPIWSSPLPLWKTPTVLQTPFVFCTQPATGSMSANSNVNANSFVNSFMEYLLISDCNILPTHNTYRCDSILSLNSQRYDRGHLGVIEHKSTNVFPLVLVLVRSDVFASFSKAASLSSFLWDV